MAVNPNINKVVFGNQTLIDLTGDTVTADKLASGYTAHDASGALITGTASSVVLKPPAPTNIAVDAGNAQATITWQDGEDGLYCGEPVAIWDRTVIVRKANSEPSDMSDGTIVVTSTVANQYSSSGYTDTGLTNETTYYYSAFAVSTDNVASVADTASGTPTAFDPSKVKWATSSWDDIATALQKHRAGEVDMTQYWHVGDVREVPFTLYKANVTDTSGTSSTEPGNSSNLGKWQDGTTWKDVGSGVSLTTHWVIADVNDGSSSATSKYAVSGQSAPAFIIHQVEAVRAMRFNFSDTNTNGWNGSALRKYLNGSYLVSGITGYYDGLPSGLRSILLPASVLAASGSSTSTTTSTDKLFLPAEKEVYGSVTYANSTAESSLVQWDYYATAANRVKNRVTSTGTGSASVWWERSPYSGDSNGFCCVISGGTAYSYYASSYNGVAPGGCI